MTYKFKNAIIRQPNKSIRNGLSSQNLHPQYEIIADEHFNYIKAIEEAGLKINLLEPLEEYPDSIFVEDPALTYKSNVIILNPFDPSRNGERDIIREEIKHFFDNISTAAVNPSGSNNLSLILSELAAPSSPIGNSINL